MKLTIAMLAAACTSLAAPGAAQQAGAPASGGPAERGGPAGGALSAQEDPGHGGAQGEGVAGLDDATIRQIQGNLILQGYDPGPADGIWGPQSRAAMQAFQATRGLEPTGSVDIRSIEALGLNSVAESLQGRIPAGQPGETPADAPAEGVFEPSGLGTGPTPGMTEGPGAVEVEDVEDARVGGGAGN